MIIMIIIRKLTLKKIRLAHVSKIPRAQYSKLPISNQWILRIPRLWFRIPKIENDKIITIS